MFNYQYFSSGSDNGSAPVSWQAIMGANAAYVTHAYMRYPASTSYRIHFEQHFVDENNFSHEWISVYLVYN